MEASTSSKQKNSERSGHTCARMLPRGTDVTGLWPACGHENEDLAHLWWNCKAEQYAHIREKAPQHTNVEAMHPAYRDMMLAQKDTQLPDWERNNRTNEMAPVAAAEKLNGTPVVKRRRWFESGQKDGGPCGTLPWTGSTSSWKGGSEPVASWAHVRPACWRSAPQLRPCLTRGWMDGSCPDPLRKAIARAGARDLLLDTRTGRRHWDQRWRSGETGRWKRRDQKCNTAAAPVGRGADGCGNPCESDLRAKRENSETRSGHGIWSLCGKRR